MTTQEQVLLAVYSAVDELNQQLPGNSQVAKSPDSILFGDSGTLDSLSLINFITLVEERVEQQLGKSVSLMDADSLSPKNSPFRTVSTLTEYIQRLLAGSDTGKSNS
jgi:acyl carrier protein